MLAIAALVAKLAVALRIPTSAYRKGSLNASGAALAGLFAVTTLVLCPTLVFAVSLLVFFFAGSRATRYKAGAKAKLEEVHHVPTARDGGKIKDTSSGNRDAWQVACNGLLGSLACAVWIANFGSTLESRTSSSALGCPVAMPFVRRDDQQSLSNALIFTAVGFFAACMGDTLASELGMLASTRPRMITSGRIVVPGTNGGITAWGTLVSFLGGQLISIAAVAVLLTEDKRCRGIATSAFQDQALLALLAIGGAAGLAGSLLDSLLGATLQETLFDKKKKIVVRSRGTRARNATIVSVGGLPILSNNAVNALASGLTGLLCGYVGWRLR